MPGPLEGFTVVELGLWVAGPSAGAVLADWGAEVVKIEPHDGDPFRGLYLTAAGVELPANPPFELDNRGKRSIALDLGTDDGKRIAHELLGARRRLRHQHAARGARAPRARLADACRRATRASSTGCVTGYGERGPDADAPVVRRRRLLVARRHRRRADAARAAIRRSSAAPWATTPPA